MKKIGPVILLLVAAYFGWDQLELNNPATDDRTDRTNRTDGPGHQTSDRLIQAIVNKTSDVQILGEGTVVKVLPDDNKGSRHQRFLLEVAPNRTILVAHNIDLAPRIPKLRNGDIVEFNGEYEWNEKGGVIHWTHHDPRKRHVGGWLKHNGATYE